MKWDGLQQVIQLKTQAARDAQTQAVNFLWYLMPNSSYDEVFEVVQNLAADDPNLVFQSNYILVTPDQMEKLGLYGSTTLEFNDLPNDWGGKAATLMNGDQVQGQFIIWTRWQGTNCRCPSWNIYTCITR